MTNSTKPIITVFWHRRDLRTTDNIGLKAALQSEFPVLPLFIFDKEILSELDPKDARVTFIYAEVNKIRQKYEASMGGLFIANDSPIEVWKKLLETYDIREVHFNCDYEPYALQRDKAVQSLLAENNVATFSHKDQVIFHQNDILKKDGTPYTVFTPYKNAWLAAVSEPIQPVHIELDNLLTENQPFPTLSELGFEQSSIHVPPFKLNDLANYAETRDIPALNSTSFLSSHLRFGTVGIRAIFEQIGDSNPTFKSELIWREFFMQILFHFPHVVFDSFKPKYDAIKWRNNEEEFKRWCEGKTGYPMVDAGMRQLNETGLMHNRVRMVTASFLCKHLLIDWRWGEAYFAQKLLDYDLSANNGNWQWAAGTGCDAAPYFRIFNPTEQQKKFDPKFEYVRKWIPEFDSFDYPEPMVDHKFARQRALDTYGAALK